MSIQRSGIHMETHFALAELLKPNPHMVDSDTDEGRAMRERIHNHYQANDGENRDIGIEMDHRHKSCVYPQPLEQGGLEPSWSPDRYVPSTFVGSRAPHVYLKDGSPIFDHFGEYWTLFEFAKGDDHEPTGSQKFVDAAREMPIPLKHVVLSDEDNAGSVWQARLVLVRPDGHVAWRGEDAGDQEVIQEVLKTITGQKAGTFSQSSREEGSGIEKAFAGTKEVTTQVEDYHLGQMGIMQD
jgi:FAD-dependent monooxygenase